MLGRLARWMRVLGYDVIYFPCISDEELIELSFSEGRTILTRDTLLIKRKTVRDNHLFIRGDDYRDQLREVIQRYPVETGMLPFSRCLLCNTSLAPVSRDSVRDRVPAYVFKTQERYAACPSCGRIYWGATHVEEMRKALRSIGIDT